ncbi:hypothetical protein NFJ02_17g27170 [Pycnococcus provasolii]
MSGQPRVSNVSMVSDLGAASLAGTNGPAGARAFDLERTKARVLRAFEGTAPTKFRTFFKTQTMDRWLKACARYVGARIDKRDHDADAELENNLAPLYAHMLLSMSDYVNTQRDKLFFESLYEATNQVLREAFAATRNTAEAEAELHRLFRSDSFNIASRKQEAKTKQTSLDLTLHELYTIRNEAGGTLNTKLLWQLFGRRRRRAHGPTAGVCSPIISSLCHTPRKALDELNMTTRSRLNTPRTPRAGGGEPKKGGLPVANRGAAASPRTMSRASPTASLRSYATNATSNGISSRRTSKVSVTNSVADSLAPGELGRPHSQGGGFMTAR